MVKLLFDLLVHRSGKSRLPQTPSADDRHHLALIIFLSGHQPVDKIVSWAVNAHKIGNFNTNNCALLSFTSPPSPTITPCSGRLRPVVRPVSCRTVTSPSPAMSTAGVVVRDFYDAINRRDLIAVEPLIAENCVYEDLIFSQPFVGRKAIIDFFRKFTESMSPDLLFVIDDISGEDTSAVGVTWHLEWQGKIFPFSKGCSFYRLELVDGKKQIIYGRDSVEPAAKPGEFALAIIGALTWILERFPQLAIF